MFKSRRKREKTERIQRSDEWHQDEEIHESDKKLVIEKYEEEEHVDLSTEDIVQISEHDVQNLLEKVRARKLPVVHAVAKTIVAEKEMQDEKPKGYSTEEIALERKRQAEEAVRIKENFKEIEVIVDEEHGKEEEKGFDEFIPLGNGAANSRIIDLTEDDDGDLNRYVHEIDDDVQMASDEEELLRWEMEQLRKGAHGAAVEAKVYLAPAKTLAKPSEFKVDDFVKSLSKTYSMEALLRKIESEIAELEERESTREQDMLLIKERIAVEQDEVKDIEKKIEKVQGNLEILNTLNERLDNLLPTLNPESDMFQIITTRSKSLARDNISPEELDETALELLEYIS